MDLNSYPWPAMTKSASLTIQRTSISQLTSDQVADILICYLVGDSSMHAEIEANATSTMLTEMKTLAEYISDTQKEGAAAQIKVEEAKQATFAQENAALTARYAIKLGHADALGKRRATEFEEEDRRRVKELDFIENKRLALEGPLVVDPPPIAAVSAPDPM